MQGKSKKRKARTKAQQDWLNDAADIGCLNDGRPCQIHHMFGETAQVKIDLVSENIGQWAINPLCPECHKAIETNSDRRGEEKRNFETLCAWWTRIHQKPLPFSDKIYTAIMEYSR